MANDGKLYACDFEIFGRVQGVFFRKYTQQNARKLQLRGWCMNTADGTVRGNMEGPNDKLNEMKKWLQEKGSPQSQIEEAVFSETKEIEEYNFKDFAIRR